jgi:tetratricopeptide (TPR) repeat protein
VGKLTHQARTALVAGEHARAIAAARSALEQAPDAPGPTLVLGIALAWQGRTQAALAILARATRHHPRSSPLHDALGVALALAGRRADARSAFHRSIELDPTALEPLRNLTRTCLEMGRTEEGEALLQQWIEQSRGAVPDGTRAGLLAEMGAALCTQGRTAAAERVLGEALRLDPELDSAHASMGEVLAQAGQMDEARSSMRSAVRIAPENPGHHERLGWHCLRQRSMSEAEDAFRRALDHRPDNPNAISGLSEVLEKEGRSEEAMALLLPLLERAEPNPNLAIAYANLCRRTRQTDQAIPLLEAAASRQRLLCERTPLPEPGTGATQPARSLALLLHKLGHLYDIAKQPGRAFEAFSEANRVRNLHFDPERFGAMVDAVIARWTTDSLSLEDGPSRLARASHGDPSPVFILGMPRSGTSLTEQILASHPRVWGGGELNLVEKLDAQLPRALCSNPPQPRPPHLTHPEMAPRLTTALLDKAAATYLDHVGQIRKGTPNDGFQAANGPSGIHAERFTDKSIFNGIRAGLLAQLFPEARLVLCRRDPVDTSLSCYFQNFNDPFGFTTRLDWMGAYARHHERLLDHWSRMESLPTLEVRYESLVEDPGSQIRRLVDFVGLPWHEACLAPHRSSRLVSTASYAQVQRPIYRSSVGRAERYSAWLTPLLSVLNG